MQGTMQLLGGRPQGDQQGQGGMSNSAPRPQQSRPQPSQQPQRESRPAPQQAAPQPAADSTALMTIFRSRPYQRTRSKLKNRAADKAARFYAPYIV